MRLIFCQPNEWQIVVMRLFLIALRKGKIKPQQIYKAMSDMRYVWNGSGYRRGYWVWKPLELKNTKRLFSIANKFDHQIDAAFKEE